MTNLTVAIIGQGKLGLPIACAAAQAGYNTIGIDVNPNVVTMLNQGQSHIDEPGIAEVLQDSLKLRRLFFTTNYNEARHVDLYLVIVPTPSDKYHKFQSTYVLEACAEIGQLLAARKDFPIVCIVSTVYPGAMTNEIQPCLEFASGKRAGTHFGLAYSPEFVALGTVMPNHLAPDFVIIGTNDEATGTIMRQYYESVTINAPPIIVMTMQTAEIAKLTLNAYITLKVSFANWIGLLCGQIAQANVDDITRALGHDRRIGHRYFSAGAPFGGPCFPRDVRALAVWAQEQAGAPTTDIPTILPWVIQDINDATLEWIVAHCHRLGGPFAILGLSYKTGCSLTEESASLRLIEAIRQGTNTHSCTIYGYDPCITKPDAALATLNVTVTKTAKQAITKAKTVVIALPYADFLKRDTIFIPGQTVIDCWRLFGKRDAAFWRQCGATYIALGKGPTDD